MQLFRIFRMAFVYFVIDSQSFGAEGFHRPPVAANNPE